MFLGHTATFNIEMEGGWEGMDEIDGKLIDSYFLCELNSSHNKSRHYGIIFSNWILNTEYSLPRYTTSEQHMDLDGWTREDRRKRKDFPIKIPFIHHLICNAEPSPISPPLPLGRADSRSIYMIEI